MDAHADSPASKGDAFVRQAQALLHPGSAAQFDFTPRAYHAMPGERAVRRAQRPSYLPRVSGKTRGPSHGAVCGYFSPGNFPYGAEQFP